MSHGADTWSDFDISLKFQADGDITRNTDIDAIKNSIHNIVSTLQGSRRMLPEFAVNVYKLLFEPITPTTANYIANNLIDSIEKWDNRLVLTAVNIYPNEDQNRYDCSMEFYIVNNPEREYTVAFVLRQV